MVRDLKSRFSDDVLNKTINRLKGLDLIKEKPSVIDDFNTLYVTADGLSAVRALQQRSLV